MSIAPIAPLNYERYGILFNPILMPVPPVVRSPIPSREVDPITAAVAPHYRDGRDSGYRKDGSGLGNSGEPSHSYRGRRVNLIA